MGMALNVLGRTDPGRDLLLPFFCHTGKPRWLAAAGRCAEAGKILTQIGGGAYAQQTLAESGQPTHDKAESAA